MTETKTLSPETVEVGEGVHYGVGSDRYAATVCEVSKSGKTIKFTNDKSRRTDSNGYGGHQEWEFETVEPYEFEQYGMTQTNVRVARWSAKHQAFMYGGRMVQPGRAAYQDPSF